MRYGIYIFSQMRQLCRKTNWKSQWLSTSLVQRGGNLSHVSNHLNNITVGKTFTFVDFIDV